MKNAEITIRQKEVLSFLCTYILTKGYAPSLREIASGLYISKMAVLKHLSKLEEKGFIKHTPKTPRSIVVLKVS